MATRLGEGGVAATSISTEILPLTAARGELRVHSAFDRAVNLRIASPTPANLPLDIVTVATEGIGNLPNGVLIPAPSASLGEWARMGEPASLSGGRLRLARCAIDLRWARPWDPSYDALGASEWTHGWLARWIQAWVRLERGSRVGAAGPLWGVLRHGVARLSAALEQHALGPALRAAEALIGLGPGLTPSGDDMLVGILVGLHCHPSAVGDPGFVAAWGAALADMAAGRTTDVSRVYLEWAVKGRATERLRDVAEAILRPPADGQVASRIAGAVERALQVGGTSGSDGVLGLLLGIRTWTNESEGDHADAPQGAAQSVPRFGDADAAIEHIGVHQGGQPGVRVHGDAGQP